MCTDALESDCHQHCHVISQVNKIIITDHTQNLVSQPTPTKNYIKIHPQLLQ